MDNSLIIPEIDFDVDPAPILIDEQEIDEIFIREAIRKDKGKARKRRRIQREQGPIIPYFPPSVEDFQPVLMNEEEITEIFLQTASSSSSSSRMTGKFKDVDIYKCKFCNQEFEATTPLRYHFQKAHGIHPDFISGKTTPISNHDVEQCLECNRFVPKEYIQYHTELYHERIRCTICKIKFRQKAQVEEHNLMKCKFDPKQNRNYFKCLVCNIEKPFNRSLIAIHYILNHLQNKVVKISKKVGNKCMLCGEVYSKNERLNVSSTIKHLKKKHFEIYKEMFGNILFSNSSEKLYMTKENESSKDSRYEQCVFCDYIPLNTKQYLNHLAHKHKGFGKVTGYKNNEKDSFAEYKLEYVVCPKCKRKVAAELYPLHLDLLHERFKCFSCFSLFEKKNIYENHILMSCRYDPLSDIKYYQCKICGFIPSSEKQKGRSNALYNHVFKIHILKSTLECPSCDFYVDPTGSKKKYYLFRKVLNHVKQNHPEILEGIQSNFLYVNNKKEFEEE